MSKEINIIVLFFVTINLYGVSNGIKICETMLDYANPLQNPNCTEDNTPELSQVQIIQSWDLNAESYTVTTQDNYIITVTRAYGNVTKANPIVLGHGVLENGFSYLAQGTKSLVNLLAQEGYDVWIANWRGTKVSRGHKTLNDSNPLYWEFSFDEMGKYDVPAILDQVQATSGNAQVIYIGFSMGCNVGYVYNLEHTTAGRLLKMISLNPGALNTDTAGGLLILFILLPILKSVPLINNNGEAFSFLVNGTFGDFCSLVPAFNLPICEGVKAAIYGPNFPQVDEKRAPIYNYLNFDATSFRIAEHFAQLNDAARFQAYDFGEAGNLVAYGTTTPKVYNFGDINVPVTIFPGGPNDFITSPRTCRQIYDGLQTQYQNGYIPVSDSNWAHYSVVEAKDVDTLLYRQVIEVL